MDSSYDDTDESAAKVTAGEHRKRVGGLWEEVGELQFTFLRDRGLKPGDRLLDVGCGCLRGGVHFVRFLDPGNYFGVDISQALLDAGYDVELKALGLQERLPRSNLLCAADFDVASFGQVFDCAMAQSLFTHLTFNSIRGCMERMAAVVKPGGAFYATFFELPDDVPAGAPLIHEPGSKASHGSKDPYHYRIADFEHAIRGLPWSLRYVGDWGHPRDQRMLAFIRAPHLPKPTAPVADATSPPPRRSQHSNPRVQLSDFQEANENAARLGTGRARVIEPACGYVTAGEKTRIVLRYETGQLPLHAGARVQFCFHHVCLWSLPQTRHPTVAGFVTASTSTGKAVAVKAWGGKVPVDHMLSRFPWQHVVEVTVEEHGLAPGDRIDLIYGAGPQAAIVQPMAADPYDFRVFVDARGDGLFLPAEEHPSIAVRGGPPANLVAVTPSDQPAGGSGWVLVRIEDIFGNLATGYAGEVRVEGPPGILPEPLFHRFAATDEPIHRFNNTRFAATEECRLEASAEGGMQGWTNPFRVRSPSAAATPTLWGEIHGHSELSDAYGTPEAYFAYARDIIGLDLAALTDHDFMLSESDWAHIKRACNEANSPDFVTIQAYEWSGSADVGGDRNLYFRDDDPPICRSRTMYDPRNPALYHGPERAANHVEDLYRWLDETVRGGDVLVVPHYGGRHANPRFHNPRYDRLVELFSEHARSEAWADKFRESGSRLGYVAGGDDHIGRPGNGFLRTGDRDPRSVHGKGLVALKANRNRSDVFQALFDRRTYATTGPRILVDFDVAGEEMGGEVSLSEPPHIRATVLGTAELERIEIIRDGSVVHVATPQGNAASARMEWTDAEFAGGEHSYWLRVVQTDGHLAVTSPVWVRNVPDDEETSVAALEDVALSDRWFYRFPLPSGRYTRSSHKYTVHEDRLEMLRRTVTAGFGEDWSDVDCLDLGAHEGFYAFNMARGGCRSVVAIEARPEHVAKADLIRRIYRLENLVIRRGDVNQVSDLPRRKFDIVLLLGLIYHLDNPVGALREASARTRKLLLIETQVAPNMTGIIDWGSGVKPLVGTFGIVEEALVHSDGITGIALVPSHAGLVWTMRKLGFARVEVVGPPPNSYEPLRTGKRIMLACWRD